MGDWAQVKAAVWEDDAFRALSSDARLIFLWSWTNPAATICGLYRASWRQLAAALGELRGGPGGGASAQDADLVARVEPALAQLAAKPLLLYDETNEVVWAVNRARHANRSPKVAVAMQREFDRCPASPLKTKFKRRYSGLLTTR
jgi:hypothetical protein